MQEQRRSEVLGKLLGGLIDRPQACQLLGVSERTLTRLRNRFVESGAAGLVHGNRSRAPANRTTDAQIELLRTLAGPGGRYADFNVCHLHQVLAASEGLFIGRSTLDRLLTEQGIRPGRRVRRKGRIFVRRDRMAQEGMMLQVDGSPHDWLEGRGPRMCLIGSIDDATSNMLYGRFHAQETQDAYILMVRQIVTKHGLPMSFYHDKHTILRSPKQATIDDELAGREPMSQVQRILYELGIEGIAANTPQAKGRVERLWQTLQDRLVKEMRLAGVNTMEQANAFLPGFLMRLNEQFGRPAADPEPAWVQAPGLDLAYYFCVKETRTVRKDHTVPFEGRILRLDAPSCLSGKKVTVHRVPEGDLYVYNGKDRLPAREVLAPAASPAATASRASEGAACSLTGVPASGHPEPKPAPEGDAAAGAAPRHTAGQRRWLYGHDQQVRPAAATPAAAGRHPGGNPTL